MLLKKRAPARTAVAWVAGVLEGEGCFGIFRPKNGGVFSPRITLAMTDQDVVLRVGKVIGGGYYGIKPTSGRPRRQPQYQWRLTGEKAIDAMRMLLPHMGERRSQTIQNILLEWKQTLEWRNVNGSRGPAVCARLRASKTGTRRAREVVERYSAARRAAHPVFQRLAKGETLSFGPDRASRIRFNLRKAAERRGITLDFTYTDDGLLLVRQAMD